MEKDFNMPDRK